MSDQDAEIAALRAEIERLNAKPRDDGGLAVRMNSSLAQHAASARREAQQYQIIQQQGLEANVGEVTPTSLDAAEIVMRDMGLL